MVHTANRVRNREHPNPYNPNEKQATPRAVEKAKNTLRKRFAGAKLSKGSLDRDIERNRDNPNDEFAQSVIRSRKFAASPEGIRRAERNDGPGGGIPFKLRDWNN